MTGLIAFIKELLLLNYHRRNNFPVDVLVNLWIFGSNYMRDNVDATIVLGEFGLEGKSIPPKCLFVA